MDSYQSRQIADLVLLISELNYFTHYDATRHPIFSRHIDCGFILTNNLNLQDLISNLVPYNPNQIPIAFTFNPYSIHYLDLIISVNIYIFVLFYKYMYPHFSYNDLKHIFPGIVKTETIRYYRRSSILNSYVNFSHYDLNLYNIPPS